MINYGVKEVTRFVVIREESSDNCGSLQQIGEFQSLEQAENIAARLSSTESGSGWYTVPMPETLVRVGGVDV